MNKISLVWLMCLAVFAAGCNSSGGPEPIPERVSTIETNLTQAEVLDTAEASPATVGVHDKQAWLALFANNAKIEDPVGTAPHIKAWDGVKGEYDDQALDNFYDTFIAPNEIIFHVKQDIIAGNEIVRDLDIETRMSTGLVLSVPTHLRYRIVKQDGELKIAHLEALWELKAMIDLVLGDDAGLSTGAAMTARMLEEQGIKGALGYAQGLTTGIFEAGKTQAQAFADAVNNDIDSADFAALFYDQAAELEFPVAQNTYSVDEFAQQRSEISLSLSEMKSAGWYTSARFELNQGGSVRDGIVYFRFDPKSRLIAQVRFFW